MIEKRTVFAVDIMPVSQELDYATIDELNLDSKNPRLGRQFVEKNLNQAKLLRLMESWKLDELALSFLENGQFWTQEALICVKERLAGKQILVVVEGNRRLAALRRLRDAFKGKPFDHHWAEMVAGKKAPPNLFTKVPYLLADDRDSVRAFLGFRHVTGIEEWRPAEKAEFIAQMVDGGMDYDAVRRKIGSRTDVVRQNYIAYRMLLQIEDLKAIPKENFEERFSQRIPASRRQVSNLDVQLPKMFGENAKRDARDAWRTVGNRHQRRRLQPPTHSISGQGPLPSSAMKRSTRAVTTGVHALDPKLPRSPMTHHKRLMIEAKSNKNSKFVSASGRFASAQDKTFHDVDLISIAARCDNFEIAPPEQGLSAMAK